MDRKPGTPPARHTRTFHQVLPAGLLPIPAPALCCRRPPGRLLILGSTGGGMGSTGGGMGSTGGGMGSKGGAWAVRAGHGRYGRHATRTQAAAEASTAPRRHPTPLKNLEIHMSTRTSTYPRGIPGPPMSRA
jgi:hypothetical protein